MAGRKGQNSKVATSYGQSRENPRGPGNRNGVDPETFKRRCRILAQRAVDSKRLERLLGDPEDGGDVDVKPADFLAALKEVANRGHGIPMQAMKVTSPDGSMTPQVWVFGNKKVKF